MTMKVYLAMSSTVAAYAELNAGAVGHHACLIGPLPSDADHLSYV